jgi:tRNA dimethylallyltransferase
MTLPPLLVAVVGPTGSGKSSLAIHLAHHLDGEVINCDSLQIFKYFDIGTAKLPEPDWQGIPHHLLSTADPGDVITAGDFSRQARQAAHQIAARGKVPIVTGGTGFYLRAMLDGLSPAPQRDNDLRTTLAQREAARKGVLHRLLRRIDRLSAVRIHAHDTPKLIRAIEIARKGASAKSAQTPAQPLEGFRIRKVGLFPPREQLYQNIEQRCEQMFSGGLVEECQSILERGIPPTVKPFEAIGYAQAMRVIAGTLLVPEALAETKMQTRRYAKRQTTWFRREHGLFRIEGFGSEAASQERAHEWLATEG